MVVNFIMRQTLTAPNNVNFSTLTLIDRLAAASRTSGSQIYLKRILTRWWLFARQQSVNMRNWQCFSNLLKTQQQRVFNNNKNLWIHQFLFTRKLKHIQSTNFPLNLMTHKSFCAARNGIDLRVTERSPPSLQVAGHGPWPGLIILWQSRIKHQGTFEKHWRLIS